MTDYTAVPTEELENWQEAREQEMLNKCIKENVARKEQAHMAGQARKEQAHMAGQARIRELERLEQQRMAEIRKLAWMAFGWVAGCTALVILAHVGAVAGWVMQVGTTTLSLVLGYTGGQLVR